VDKCRVKERFAQVWHISKKIKAFPYAIGIVNMNT
jgi:hypothetical protein